MDEPNANLDAAGEAALTAAIARLRKAGRTVVVIAHRRTVLASVNRVLVLKDGKQAAFGPPEKVFGTGHNITGHNITGHNITGRKVDESEAINDNRTRLGVGARSR